MSYSPQDPYGYGYGYGIPGHPHQYGPFGPPPPPPSNGAAIAALVANVLLTITCCGIFAIPGIITSAIAVSRSQTDPASARTLTLWSWAIFGAAILLGIVILVLFFVLGLNESSDGPTYSAPGDDGVRI